MPFSQFRVLPTQGEGVNINAISVPNVFRPADAFNTQLQVSQELRARKLFEFEEEKFAYQKALNKTALIDKVAEFASSSAGTEGGGLKGHTAFSKRVSQEVSSLKSNALSQMAALDDPAEIQQVALKFRAQLEGNSEYQEALQQDIFVDNALKAFTDPRNANKFDEYEVGRFLEEVRGGDSATSKFSKGEARVSIEELYFGRDFDVYDVKNTANLVKSLSQSQKGVREQVNPDGTTAIINSEFRQSPEEVQAQYLKHLESPKVRRELAKFYGTSDQNELASILTQTTGVYPTQDTDKDGIVRDDVSITNVDRTTTKERELILEERRLINEGRKVTNANAKQAGVIQKNSEIYVPVYNAAYEKEFLKSGDELAATTAATLAVERLKASQKKSSGSSSGGSTSLTDRNSNNELFGSTFSGVKVTKKELVDSPLANLVEGPNNRPILILKQGDDAEEEKYILDLLKNKKVIPDTIDSIDEIPGYKNGQVIIQSDLEPGGIGTTTSPTTGNTTHTITNNSGGLGIRNTQPLTNNKAAQAAADLRALKRGQN